ncbi:MAG TPA: LysR family transcriptional regulator [Elainellaceae cyanobacterium]
MKGNSQNQMKLSQLRILVAVAEHGNFSEAALGLELSQSAVSHAIATLENHLGIVLVHRGRHGARLTPVGEHIAEHALEMIRHADEIEREAQLAKGLTKGQIRIASFRSAATQILPAVIAKFHQRFPAIAVILDEHDDYLHIEQALHDGRADIGFTFMPVGKGLEGWDIYRDEFVALFPDTVKLSGSQLTWDELASQPMIMPPINDVMMRRVYNHLYSHGCRPNIAYEVETDSTIVSLVAQGLGATILPRLAAEPIPANVKAYSLPDPLERIIGVAVLAHAMHPPPVYAFLDILKDSCLTSSTEI